MTTDALAKPVIARQLVLARVRAVVADQRWGISVSVIALMAFLVVYEHSPASHEPGRSDGFYTWLYTRSLVFDHDVNFTNDYALCGDPFGWGVDRGGKGHPDDPYYIGPSLFWAPILWISRQLITIPKGAPPPVVQGCTGPLTNPALHVACLLGALTIYFGYRVARRFVGDGTAALAAALMGMGGTLAAYSSVMPAHSHVYVAFAVSVLLVASLRAFERPESLLRWAAAALAIAFCGLERTPELVWGLVPAGMAFARLRLDRRRLLPALAILGLGGIVGLVPQLFLYKYFFDTYVWTAPAGRHYLHLGHAHPFLLLFGPHGGLFFSTPVVWLAALGVWPSLRSKTTLPLAATVLLLFVFELIFYSAPVDWDGAGTFGARRLTTFAPAFTFWGALSLDAIRRWLSRSPHRAITGLGIAVAVPAVFVVLGVALSLGKGALPTDVGSSQADFYGVGTRTAWSLVDEIGDLSILPAELVFQLRYGLPMNRFRDATENYWYQRHFVHMNFVANNLPMNDARLARTALGFDQNGDGMRITGRRASLVFAAQWPFATDLVVSAKSVVPAHVRIGRGLVFGRTLWFGDMALPGQRTETVVKLPIPEGGFDSGINELVFETSDGDGGVTIHNMVIEDNAPYPPAYPKGPQ